jgi:hypothetical protein
MNKIRVSGVSFEVACENARLLSLTDDYKGCAVHVNVHVVKTIKDEVGLYMFVAIFGTSDWYDSDCTVATYVNGNGRS